MTDYTVYALTEPAGEWRYIGITQHPWLRYDQHLSAARTQRDQSAKGDWIRDLLSQGSEPAYEILSTDLPQNVAQMVERGLIERHRDTLLNLSGGGQTGARRYEDGFTAWLPGYIEEEVGDTKNVTALARIIGGTAGVDWMDDDDLELIRALTFHHYAHERLRWATDHLLGKGEPHSENHGTGGPTGHASREGTHRPCVQRRREGASP